MKHMAFGKVGLLGVFVLAGCYSYPSDAINNTNYKTLQASPVSIVINAGDSDQVILRLINDFGNGAITGYTISAVGAGIRVDSSCTVPDLTSAQQIAASCNGYYRPVFNSAKDTLVPSGPGDAAQFYVVGLANGTYSFTATPNSVNTGISRTVSVVVNPITLGPALSKTTGVAGDTIILTAPLNTVFSQTSAVTFVNGQVAIVGRSADSTTITLIAGPGITGPATVTLVGNKTNAAIPPITLVTSNTLTTAQITVAPTTLSTLTPALDASFTVTLGGGLRFTPSSTVTLGTTPTLILSRSADSSSAVVIPFGGITGGLVSYKTIVLSFLNGVPLNLPGNQSVTLAPVIFDPNTNDPSTAPTIALPAPGATSVVTGTGPFNNSPGFGPACGGSTGDGCQLYKFVVAATTVVDLKLVEQGGGQDMGIYRLNSTATTATSSGSTGNCDGSGQEAAPESCTMTLAPGTYFFAIVFFGTGSGYDPGPDTVAPTWFQFSMHTH